MDSQTKVELIHLLGMILIPISIAVIIAISVLVYLKMKEKKDENNSEKNIEDKKGKSNTSANKQSVFNFMEFDKVEDNMIVQKNGNRYLMVVECQGINYDLMSGVEKNGVEQGFVQFLNTLRSTIQIYIQTRSVNLENSLRTYKEKVKEVEEKYRKMQREYEKMLESDTYTDEQIQKAYFELTKQANLYEYGTSVIKDTERMSLNKNILNKKYYIIVPYYAAEAGNDNLDKEEIKNIAFSELYTKCQAIITSISVCGVRGKILRSNELIELLYMSYNRDEAEIFGLDKALKAGYNELYSTAPDVYEKKMKELDKIIEERAMKKAMQKVNEVRSEMQKEAEDKEANMEKIIDQVAKLILKENQSYIGKDVANRAIEKMEQTKEGGNVNGKKTRGRKKVTTAK